MTVSVSGKTKTYHEPNSEMHQEILENFITRSLEDLCYNCFIFQHDLESSKSQCPGRIELANTKLTYFHDYE